MPITTSVQTKYSVRLIAVAVVCLVLGLWGVYDYLVAIPANTRAYQRGQVYVAVKTALAAEPGTQAARDRIIAADELITPEIEALLQLGLRDGAVDPKAFVDAVEKLEGEDDQAWFGRLMLFRGAMREAATRRPGSATSKEFQTAYDLAERGVNATGNVPAPGKWDRATQWLFMLCLPCTPYFVWQLIRTRRRTSRLDEDGTLTTPAGTWAPDDIADIDMSRWMAKSVAWVVHRDGTRVKLDDYVFRRTHLIVGALASARYPETWEPDGRLRKRESAADEGGAESGDRDDASGADEAELVGDRSAGPGDRKPSAGSWGGPDSPRAD